MESSTNCNSCAYDELQSTYQCQRGDKWCDKQWGQPSYYPPNLNQILVPSWGANGGYNALTKGMGPSCNGYRSIDNAYNGLDQDGNCSGGNNCSGPEQTYRGFVPRQCAQTYNGQSNRRCN